MADLLIRNALPADAARIAGIYNHYILHSTITFDTEPKSPQERAQWIDDHDALHPVLVGEVDGDIVVWGALTRWGLRPAYRHTSEVSVYVDRESRGRGIGQAMTEALIAEADRLGHHALISQVVSDNEASIKVAERLGFERVGLLKEVGRKFDRWLDVVVMERLLIGPYEQSH